MQLNLSLFRGIIRKATHLYIAPSSLHGRGVFSEKPIKKGALIEKAPVILINHAEIDILRHTVLYHYYFVVNDPDKPVAIGLGFSSLYNHSCPANAAYKITTGKPVISIKAVRDIAAGEEITINYHGDPANDSPVIFPEQ